MANESRGFRGAGVEVSQLVPGWMEQSSAVGFGTSGLDKPTIFQQNAL
jgi:hypothetical protein